MSFPLIAAMYLADSGVYKEESKDTAFLRDAILALGKAIGYSLNNRQTQANGIVQTQNIILKDSTLPAINGIIAGITLGVSDAPINGEKTGIAAHNAGYMDFFIRGIQGRIHVIIHNSSSLDEVSIDISDIARIEGGKNLKGNTLLQKNVIQSIKVLGGDTGSDTVQIKEGMRLSA